MSALPQERSGGSRNRPTESDAGEGFGTALDATEGAAPQSLWLSGVMAPIDQEYTALDLPVTGQIPEALDGLLVRNGPNPIGPKDPTTHHWFLGDAMVHGVRLRDGKAEWYRNRWVRSPSVAELLDDPVPPSPFGPDVPDLAPNTNVISLAGQIYAIVEGGSPPVAMSDDLATIGPSDFGGTLEHPFSAHPKVDPVTGSLHVASYYFGWGNKVRYMVVSSQGRVVHSADFELPGQPMMHDISITETRAMLYDLPCVFNLDAAMSGWQLPYRWDPDYQARLGVLPLGGTAEDTTWIDIDPCYVFHPVNAYDDGDRIVADVVRWEKMFDQDQTGPAEGGARIERWVIDPVAGTKVATIVDDRDQELPRIDERLVGRRHRYGYVAESPTSSGPARAIRHDFDAEITEFHDFGPGRVTSEMIFVPSGPDSPEDDGWCLSFVYNPDTGKTDLVILNAGDFTGDPVASIGLPTRVPTTFHGNWLPSS